MYTQRIQLTLRGLQATGEGGQAEKELLRERASLAEPEKGSPTFAEQVCSPAVWRPRGCLAGLAQGLLVHQHAVLLTVWRSLGCLPGASERDRSPVGQHNKLLSCGIAAGITRPSTA